MSHLPADTIIYTCLIYLSSNGHVTCTCWTLDLTARVHPVFYTIRLVQYTFTHCGPQRVLNSWDCWNHASYLDIDLNALLAIQLFPVL